MIQAASAPWEQRLLRELFRQLGGVFLAGFSGHGQLAVNVGPCSKKAIEKDYSI